MDSSLSRENGVVKSRSLLGKYPFYYIFFRGIRKYMG